MKNLFVFLAIVLLFSSCGKDKNPVKPDENSNEELFPLKVGNTWQYIDTMYTENGDFLYAETSKLGITGSAEINYATNKVKVYYWNWYNMGTNQPRDEKWLASVENSSLYFYGGRYFDVDFVFFKSLQFKYPVSVNETWKRSVFSSNSSDSTFEYAGDLDMSCISINEKLKTPYGEFNCIVYHYKTTSLYGDADAYFYASKGYGYVGLIVKTNGIVTFKKLLKSQKLEKFQKENIGRNKVAKPSNDSILFDGRINKK